MHEFMSIIIYYFSNNNTITDNIRVIKLIKKNFEIYCHINYKYN